MFFGRQVVICGSSFRFFVSCAASMCRTLVELLYFSRDVSSQLCVNPITSKYALTPKGFQHQFVDIYCNVFWIKSNFAYCVVSFESRAELISYTHNTQICPKCSQPNQIIWLNSQRFLPAGKFVVSDYWCLYIHFTFIWRFACKCVFFI